MVCDFHSVDIRPVFPEANEFGLAFSVDLQRLVVGICGLAGNAECATLSARDGDFFCDLGGYFAVCDSLAGGVWVGAFYADFYDFV